MKIIAIDAFPFRLRPRRDFKWAGLRLPLGGFVVVRVRTDEGLVGYGEATPLPDWGGDYGRRSGETQATVAPRRGRERLRKMRHRHRAA